MASHTEVLDRLVNMFEQAERRLLEDRLKRWQNALHGRAIARRGGEVSAAFEGLRQGEIGLEDFLHLKIERAMRPLRSLLDEEDLAFLRMVVKARLDSDPVVAKLVDRIVQFTQAGHERFAADQRIKNGE